MFKHLLVPLDGSEFAENALAYATSLADNYQSKITLVQVLPPGKYEWKAEMKAELPNAEDKIQRVEASSATLYLETKERELTASGYDVSGLIMPGKGVADAILKAAESEKADTIIMTTHGLKGIQRLMLGSVAERVSRHAPIPILLVRVANQD